MKKDIKQNEIWGSSLRIFPWDKKGSITEVESLISNTLLEWYKEKHRSPSLKELQLLNSLEKNSCPYCGSAQFIKKGFYKNGLQRYSCKDGGADKFLDLACYFKLIPDFACTP